LWQLKDPPLFALEIVSQDADKEYALHNPQRFAGSEGVKELAHESTSCAV
jgi:hypothetical protein